MHRAGRRQVSFSRITSSLTLLAVVVMLAPIARAAPKRERPNVLFLFSDDQRPDTIGALGNPVIKTPNLDRLVRRGFSFSNAYCMGSTRGAVCYPSRHMTLSGMSLYRYDPKKREGTFGDVMRKAGYLTYHQSKRGNTAREYHKAFEHSSYLQDQKERTSGHHGRSAANAALEFLEKHRDRTAPVFMYIGFAGPHDPRVAAPEWMELYDRDAIPLPPNYKPFHPIDNDWMTGRDERLAPWPRTEEVVRKHLHDYYACISSIDHHIGRVIAKLEELGELDDTLIVFSADHGLAVGSHGLFGKQSVYEHSMGAPLVFAGPGVRHGSSNAFAYLFDIFPTVCELAGVESPPQIEGRSLAPVIRGERDGVRDVIFLSYMEGQRAVRRGDWKLIRYPKVNFTQLFNLADDPHELENLADRPELASRVDELMRLLAAEQKRWGDTMPLTSKSPGPASIDLDFFKRDAEKQRGKRKKARRKTRS